MIYIYIQKDIQKERERLAVARIWPSPPSGCLSGCSGDWLRCRKSRHCSGSGFHTHHICSIIDLSDCSCWYQGYLYINESINRAVKRRSILQIKWIVDSKKHPRTGDCNATLDPLLCLILLNNPRDLGGGT